MFPQNDGSDSSPLNDDDKTTKTSVSELSHDRPLSSGCFFHPIGLNFTDSCTGPWYRTLVVGVHGPFVTTQPSQVKKAEQKAYLAASRTGRLCEPSPVDFFVESSGPKKDPLSPALGPPCSIQDRKPKPSENPTSLEASCSRCGHQASPVSIVFVIFVAMASRSFVAVEGDSGSEEIVSHRAWARKSARRSADRSAR